MAVTYFTARAGYRGAFGDPDKILGDHKASRSGCVSFVGLISKLGMLNAAVRELYVNEFRNGSTVNDYGSEDS